MNTIIIRHRRENLKKCSLRGLENHPNLRFMTYPMSSFPSLNGYLMLSMEGPELSLADQSYGLLLIDATWKLASVIQRKCPDLPKRSLPKIFQTAYPRRQTDCPDPETGLASIEALYLAHLILQRPIDGLLDSYHWKNQFLERNHLTRTNGSFLFS